jgi:hypothetical protein
MSDPLTLSQLRARLSEAGATHVYVKFLAPNDNSKNQVYLGGDFGILNVLPAGSPIAMVSGKHATPIFQAALDLRWMNDSGALFAAPHAKLILYPQYPEVRMSGYLLGATWSPNHIMGGTREPGRVLVLGVSRERGIVAYAAGAGEPVAKELAAYAGLDPVGVLFRLPGGLGVGAEQELLDRLCVISQMDWVPAMRLNAAGALVPCPAQNCGGLTLEALLDVRPNSRAEPDFLGWEVKSYTVRNLKRAHGGPVTLMTPEPTGGFYAERGVAAFIRRFGYKDLRGREGRQNFGGVHRVGKQCARTGLTLAFDGFDQEQRKIANAAGCIALVDTKDVIAASWSFADLLAHWNRKHAAAVFVPTQRHRDGGAYRFGSTVSLGTGADFLRVLAALADGLVYYDPGMKLVINEKGESSKRRSQFRMHFRSLSLLYGAFREVDACEEQSAS